MYEELTPGMRFNYGNVISAKDDTPPCVRRRMQLRDDPNFFEEHGYTKEDIAWFKETMVHDDDTCICQPGVPGVVWSQVLTELGPYDKEEWHDRNPELLEREMQWFLNDAELDAQRYNRAMEQRYAEVEM